MSLCTRLIDAGLANLQLVRAWNAAYRARPRSEDRQNQRNLLILAWEFAPQIAGGVYRPAALSKYAARAGWKVTVVSGPAPAQPSSAGCALREYVGASVRTLQINAPQLTPSYKLFPDVDGSLLAAIAMFDLVRSIMRSQPPTVVVATGPPFHDFVAGYFVAAWAQIPLILDYRDEWTQCPFDFVAKGRANHKWERRCLFAADRVIFTTSTQRDRLSNVCEKFDVAKSEIIPNGWEPSEFRAAPNSSRRPEVLTLLFAGKLGGH